MGTLSLNVVGYMQQAVVDSQCPASGIEVRHHVAHGGHDGEPVAPACVALGGTEAAPDLEQGGGVGATVDKGDGRLGHDQPEVVLEAVLEATPLVGDLVAAGRGVDPDVAAPHLERVAAHVVGEGVEGAARTELEAGVMPVADDDAVADGAAR